MLAKIWRWLKKLWQQLLGKPPQPSPRSAGTPGRVEKQRLSDAEFESLFLQLLDRVEEGASRGNIKSFFITKIIDEDELAAWLRRFGSKLLESPETHRKLARRMVQLGKVAGGELGDMAGEIGRELLGNSETQTSIVATSVIPTVNKQTANTTNSVYVDVAVDVDGEAVEWFKLGVDEYNAGNVQAALGCFQRALDISPNNHIAWNSLSSALSDLGQYQEAIEAYQRALDISPNNHIAWNGLGNALKNLGQYQEAREAHQRAINISPNYHHAWNGLGNALSDLGQYQEAREAYQRALDISPNYHHAWNNLGATLYDLGQYQEARKAYQRALDISLNSHHAWNGLGNALSDLGQYQQAIEAFQRALDISPNFHHAWNGLGNALKNLGQYQEAREACNRALEITHNQLWQAWANRGWAIYYLQGYQAALQNWDKGLQSLQPETRDYQEGCATLHQHKGDAHYLYGKRQPNPHPYWRESRNSYITALKTLSRSQTSILGEVLVAQVSPRFQLLYLEILQKLAKVCNALNYQEDFQLCLDIGDTMLENLLLETDSQERKIQLAKKFATFSQLRVVLLAQSSQLKEALLLAEKRKNLCLRWLRESRYVGMLDETPLQYSEIEQFLSPGMAAIYWHYSPAAITTFIIKHNGIQIHLEEPPSPNPFPRNGGRGEGEDDSDSLTPFSVSGRDSLNSAEEPPSPNPFPRNGGRGEGEDDSDSLTPFPLQREKGETETQTQTEKTTYTLAPLPVAGRGWGWGSTAKQLQKFEDWLKKWKKDYQTNPKDAKGATKEKQTWRDKMADRLDKLGKILNVEGILNKIGDDITQLILIPHRDLHLLPLHYLWREKDFTITYLPSLQIGIDLRTDTPSTPTKLLSIESPSRLEYAETESQIIAQLYDNPTCIKSSKATKNTVIAAFSNSADIFHFTGHGEHNIHQPLESALELANKEMLTLQDIFQLNLKGYQLACLSACETGLTSKQGIMDEYVGLVSGFLAKGVTHVVTTLWQVGETETALMMIKFHQLYKDNIPPALALQQTQTWLSTLTFADLIQWYRQESAKVEKYTGCWESLQGLIAKAQEKAESKGMNHRPYAHPYYWAGFIVSGNQINCFGVGTRHN
ncbi:CHAT domain-containing protein [Argonema galeatum]|uniref:CHAT domain-containing protein n=1 Tax=Argonema galeatum TaxID=2942762 RepID=UPI0020136316|nr:CHAT domain-containing tetratricopeptide repeat protein [Argonema galeatum]MCL1463620.1 tetratricopeptide repeat protein [Argonema galeatum A003/A1]